MEEKSTLSAKAAVTEPFKTAIQQKNSYDVKISVSDVIK